VHRVPYDQLTEVDRWALLRLNRLIPRIVNAYEAFEFHMVFHALNNFCSVDMSAIYLDILKDRLYTFHKDSPFRRAAQTVLLEVLTAVTKLMAPVLGFTSDEIWRLLPESARGGDGAFSVHLARFPKEDPGWTDEQLEQRWERLLAVRTVVQSALEAQRRDRVIGSSLEARVTLHAEPKVYELLSQYATELPALLIVSQVAVHAAEKVVSDGHLLSDAETGIMVDVEKAHGTKCERCWNYRTSVGTSPEHPTLCDRCVEAIH
jgi:isoleucyl-tRNA synthetase